MAGDYIGTFLNAGGSGVYYFHYLPLEMENNCNDSLGTFGMFTVTPEYEIKQPLSQYFTSRMINFEGCNMMAERIWCFLHGSLCR